VQEVRRHQEVRGPARAGHEGQGPEPEKVACPKNVEAKVGTTFVCKVTIAGEEHGFEATVDKIEGDDLTMSTRWVDGKGVLGAKIEEALSKELSTQLGAVTQIDCGAPLRFLDADNTLTCKATVLTHTLDAKLTFNDALDVTGWSLIPEPVVRDRLVEILKASVTEKLGPAVTITCGADPILVVPASNVVECAVTDGTQSGKLMVTFKAGTPEVERWEVVQ
jgi:hypothetical protein